MPGAEGGSEQQELRARVYQLRQNLKSARPADGCCQSQTWHDTEERVGDSGKVGQTSVGGGTPEEEALVEHKVWKKLNSL